MGFGLSQIEKWPNIFIEIYRISRLKSLAIFMIGCSGCIETYKGRIRTWLGTISLIQSTVRWCSDQSLPAIFWNPWSNKSEWWPPEGDNPWNLLFSSQMSNCSKDSSAFFIVKFDIKLFYLFSNIWLTNLPKMVGTSIVLTRVEYVVMVHGSANE